MRPFHRKLPREPMRVLVRHADAGSRREWAGPDEWRGLSRLGHEQALEVVGRVGALPVLRVLSSPALRCRQTVVPLARTLSLDVEICRWLGRDAHPVDLMRFLEAPETENAVLCTHREVLLGVFAHLASSGSRLIEGLVGMEMAAAWALYGGGDAPARLRLLRPAAESVGWTADPCEAASGLLTGGASGRLTGEAVHDAPGTGRRPAVPLFREQIG